jgi:hypothetical protein
MRIVQGICSLADPGGTETYVLTVAHELERLGHEVVLVTHEPGLMAEHAASHGFEVATDGGMWPVDCDAVLTHDAIIAGELADRYPDVRLVHFAHSPVFDHQLPLLVPHIVSAVVVASELVAERIRALPLDAPIVRLRHPVDTDRFTGGAIGERPRRALLLSNYLKGPRRAALVDAWEAAGVECVQLGMPTSPMLEIVGAILEADIVVGKGRAALEGMSCARAVYVYDEFGGDGWITPHTYAQFEAANFSGLASTDPRGPGELGDDLADYNSDMGWLNRELAVRHHGARRHAQDLVKVLRGTDSAADDRTSATAELSRLARQKLHAERLAGASGRELSVARQSLATWRDRALTAERELERARSVLRTRRVRTGIRLGRALDRIRPLS